MTEHYDHDYTKRVDADERLVYVTTHQNGERTEVEAQHVAEDDPAGENWRLRAVDYDTDGAEIDDVALGYASRKEYAENAIHDWAAAHPKGLADNGGGML